MRRKFPRVLFSRGLFGDIAQLHNDSIKLYGKAFQECGDIGRIRFGPLFTYIVFHPDLIREVLQKQADNYLRETRGYENLRLVFGRGLLTSDGAIWHQQRQQVIKYFSPSSLVKLIPLISDSVSQRLNLWPSFFGKNQYFNIYEEMANMTLLVFDSCYLDGRLCRYINEFRNANLFMQDFLWRKTTKTFSWPLFFPSAINRQFQYHRKNITKIISNLIAEYQSISDPQTSFLSAVLDNTPRSSDGNLDVKAAAERLCTFIHAGHETTATMLTWTWYLLSQYPEVEDKLRKEINSVIGNRQPTAENLAQLVYTEQVLKESLRLYPPIWHLSKRSIKASEVGGYCVPAHTSVIICQYWTHRHPQFWDDPESFIPERFATENISKIHPFAFFPFGAGPHTCLGQMLSFLEAKIIIVKAMSNYRFILSGNISVDIESRFELLPKGGLWMKIKE